MIGDLMGERGTLVAIKPIEHENGKMKIKKMNDTYHGLQITKWNIERRNRILYSILEGREGEERRMTRGERSGSAKWAKGK